MHALDRSRRTRILWLTLTALLLASGCDTTEDDATDTAGVSDTSSPDQTGGPTGLDTGDPGDGGDGGNTLGDAPPSRPQPMPTPGQVDVLLVVDNSNSMCEEQAALSEVADELVGGLRSAGADFRIAVVTTDMVDLERGAGQFVREPGTYQLTSACTLTPPDTSACPAGGAAWLDGATASDDAALVAELQCRLSAGIDGSPVEMGLGAVNAALARPEQSAFLRPGSRLVVAFVTDENDCSDGTAGADHGVVYSVAIGGEGDAVCEFNRNLEDSCVVDTNDSDWPVPAEPDPVIEHMGESKPASQWCIEGDHDTVRTLASQLPLDCEHADQCTNQLLPRRVVLDVLLDRLALTNQLEPHEVAEPFLSVAAVVNADSGLRYDSDEQPQPTCGVGQQGYRYQHFAAMLGGTVIPICDPASEAPTNFGPALIAAIVDAVP